MDSFSLNRDLTLIMKNAKQDYCRIWGRNALGKLSGVTVSTTGSDQTEELLGDHRASLTLPVSAEDIEYVTLPEAATYFPLPGSSEVPDPPPTGAMFCDVYEQSEGRFKKIQDGRAIEDVSTLTGGVTGPGIEFFYPPETRDYRGTSWELSVPAFRDSLTPSLPKRTIQSLFEYGCTDNSKSPVTASKTGKRPTLRSAI